MRALCDCCDRSVCARVDCEEREHLTVLEVRVRPRGYGQWRQRRDHDLAFCRRHR